MRTLTIHHDGHGLNESLILTSDELGSGGAAHLYTAAIGGLVCARIQFQQGPRLDPDSTPGCTEALLLAILIDRLRSFQAGPYACRENAIQLTKLEETLMWTRQRADDRAARGVLGKNEK